MKNLITLVMGMTLTSSLWAGSLNCTSQFCQNMNNEERKAIDKIINDTVDEQNDFSKKSHHVVAEIPQWIDYAIPSPKPPAIPLERVERTVIHSSREGSEATVEFLNSNRYRSFRYNLNNQAAFYFLADIYLDKELFIENEPYIHMSTVGFGTKVTRDWTVEVSFIKEIRNSRQVVIKDLGLKPSGMMLTFKRRW
jgi:hypothetical protein